jgi:hypothetical protein
VSSMVYADAGHKNESRSHVVIKRILLRSNMGKGVANFDIYIICI